MGILQILKLYAQFKDVRKIYEDSTGTKASILMSRKFIGAVLVFLSAVLLYAAGVQIDQNTLTQLTDSIANLISAIVGIVGFIAWLVSALKNAKKAIQ